MGVHLVNPVAEAHEAERVLLVLGPRQAVVDVVRRPNLLSTPSTQDQCTHAFTASAPEDAAVSARCRSRGQLLRGCKRHLEHPDDCLVGATVGRPPECGDAAGHALRTNVQASELESTMWYQLMVPQTNA